jgi:predicted metalloprotease
MKTLSTNTGHRSQKRNPSLRLQEPSSPAGRARVCSSRLRRTVAALAVALAVLAAPVASTENRAQALRPQQNDVVGVVNRLTPNMNYFWWSILGARYRPPAYIYYYNYGSIGHVTTGCGAATWAWKWGSYCPSNNWIYLDYRGLQSYITFGFGDYVAGGLLAHEWAHSVQPTLGVTAWGPKREYHADCLAGMYTKYAYWSGLLDSGDFWEFHRVLSLEPNSTTHGDGAVRAAAFWWGYTNYSIDTCGLYLL